MTARTLSETEGEPATWPTPAAWLNEPGFVGNDFERAVPFPVVWQRIEAWITRRWPARSVIYVAEGPGWWQPRLEPFTATTTELWRANAWEACTLDPSPMGGLELPGEGLYRVTGTAGDDGDIPDDVHEAFARLYQYFRGIGQSAWTETAIYRTGEAQAVASWAAKAIHLSGAADLLRPYRKLGAS